MTAAVPPVDVVFEQARAVLVIAADRASLALRLIGAHVSLHSRD
ncbi:MAG: hypothetical protein SFX73_30215 [Kofleriaceae bacterium]|nr:hypothetical protein [Kofleriaceae bacterium]